MIFAPLVHRPDFLRVRLLTNSDSLGMKAAVSCVPNSSQRPLFGGVFVLEYFGVIGKDERKILKLLDGNRNIVGQVSLRAPNSRDKKPSSLDLSGNFCRFYWADVWRLLAVFGVAFDDPRMILRLDYCFDYALPLGKVKGFLDTVRFNPWANNRKIQDGRLVWLSKKTKRFTLRLYDKKLDILENGLLDTVPAHGPGAWGWADYAGYMRLGLPVTRLEIEIGSEFWIEEDWTLETVLKDPFLPVLERVKWYVRDWESFVAGLGSVPSAKTMFSWIVKKDVETDYILAKREKLAKTMTCAWMKKLADSYQGKDAALVWFVVKAMKDAGVKPKFLEAWEIAGMFESDQWDFDSLA